MNEMPPVRIGHRLPDGRPVAIRRSVRLESNCVTLRPDAEGKLPADIGFALHEARDDGEFVVDTRAALRQPARGDILQALDRTIA